MKRRFPVFQSVEFLLFVLYLFVNHYACIVFFNGWIQPLLLFFVLYIYINYNTYICALFGDIL